MRKRGKEIIYNYWVGAKENARPLKMGGGKLKKPLRLDSLGGMEDRVEELCRTGGGDWKKKGVMVFLHLRGQEVWAKKFDLKTNGGG